VLEKSLRLLHPFIPFITEEIWQKLREIASDKAELPQSIMHALWPVFPERKNISETVYEFDLFQKTVSGVRDVRTRVNIPPAEKVEAIVAYENENVRKSLSVFK